MNRWLNWAITGALITAMMAVYALTRLRHYDLLHMVGYVLVMAGFGFAIGSCLWAFLVMGRDR